MTTAVRSPRRFGSTGGSGRPPFHGEANIGKSSRTRLPRRFLMRSSARPAPELHKRGAPASKPQTSRKLPDPEAGAGLPCGEGTPGQSLAFSSLISNFGISDRANNVNNPFKRSKLVFTNNIHQFAVAVVNTTHNGHTPPPHHTQHALKESTPNDDKRLHSKMCTQRIIRAGRVHDACKRTPPGMAGPPRRVRC